MKRLILLTMILSLQAIAKGQAQTLTLSLKNAPLEKAFTEIKLQTGHTFIFTRQEIQRAANITVNITQASLTEALNRCFTGQPLSYHIEGSHIIVRAKIEQPEPTAIIIRGVIVNEKEEPLDGVTVAGTSSGIATTTNKKGEFNIPASKETLLISCVGYHSQEIPTKEKQFIKIALQTAVPNLDETILIAYGKTTKRFNTGSVSKVTAEEIDRQPVNNPLATLQGRVPGLSVTQTSGLNGAAYKVQIRGQNSLFQGNEPLFIIDGVPFSPGNIPINQLSNAAAAGISPFNLLNPSDIESIEVLKDADATAIYGSRGANGVILITTKKGKAGKTSINLTMYTGYSRITRSLPMLDTKQYLQMRREAFSNSGITPTTDNAPDLLVWDTTRYTDFKKELMGGTANTNDIQLSVRGGNNLTKFMLRAGYHRQTTVLPGNFHDTRSSVHLNLDHTTENKKFNITWTTNYSSEKNILPLTDPSLYINRPPHMKTFDETGQLSWEEAGISFRSLGILNANPFATMKQRYTGNFQNLLSNLTTNVELTKKLKLTINAGYSLLLTDEYSSSPSRSLDPHANGLPFSSFGTGTKKSWITEPQLHYNNQFQELTITALAGASWQENKEEEIYISATNYTNDNLLNSIAAAGNIFSKNNYLQYRYSAVFGRLSAKWKQKYLINASARRDGSSRFGPGKQYSNFGAMGMAWIFSEEPLIKNNLPKLSFAKLRTSYGVTGNDQVGDYRYLDAWNGSSNTYQDINTMNPASLYNPSYAWESTKKWEAAIEFGMFNNFIFVAAVHYRNRSGNQLVNYNLPSQTGFNSIIKNIDAIVQNRGWEVEIKTLNKQSKNFTWKTSFNLTLPKNKLLKFPGLTNSYFANTYIIGEPVSARKRYEYLGVNVQTGIYMFRDIDQNNIITTADRTAIICTDPKFYGGLSNNITWKNFQAEIVVEFRKQKGPNYISAFATTVPGYRFNNQPTLILERWQKPGDRTHIQKYIATTGQAHTYAANYLAASDAAYSDASYMRCKNLSLQYMLPNNWSKKIMYQSARIFFQCQNIFTITNYKGADPETQNSYLPPMKTMAIGCTFNF